MEKTILITGSKGFIGRKLIEKLELFNNYKLLKYDRDTTTSDLENFLTKADYIFHFAAVQRPKKGQSYKDNIKLTAKILELLKKNARNIPIIFTSSVQVELNNDYAKSKLLEENLLLLELDNAREVYIFRLPNLFGPGSKPNYTSVVATFCYNVANNLPSIVNDKNHMMNLVYIDEVIELFINLINDGNLLPGIIKLDHLVNKITLGNLLLLIEDIASKSNLTSNAKFIGQMRKTYEYYKF